MAASKFRISSSSFTGDASFSGSVIFNQDVTISGTLNVYEMKTTLVSSSIIFKSGSTKFGDTSDDLHQFTGSAEFTNGLSGSLTKLVDGTSYLIAGTNITIATGSNGAVTISSTGGGSDVFKTISVAGQSDVVADSATDTLTLTAAGGMTITTDAASDRITFSSSDTDTTYSAGTGIDLTGTTFSVDPNSLTTDANNGSLDDEIMIADFSDSGNPKKLTLSKVQDLVNTNTTYTAGDGLDLTSTEFSLNLKIGGGLKIDTTELAVEVNDFAGTGLEDDGSDNLRISTSAAGNGLTGGGGSALSIDINGLSADTNAGNLLDSIAIADNSDSNTVKKITLSQLQTLIDTDTTYSEASSSTLGLIKIEDDTVQTTAANTVSSTASRTYGIQLNSSGQAVVNVPWTDTVGTTYTAGTGLDLVGSEFSVDVSDFMTNGINNRVITATGTDGMNAEANLTFDGTDLSVSGKVKTTGLEYTDGDNAITVQNGGYLKFDSGVTHSPAVKVNGNNNTTADQWIKIATTETGGTSGDTIITNLLVNICGNEGPTDNADDVYATFLIHAEFTALSTTPYYYANGTSLYVDVFTNDQLGGFNPTTDIFISYESDSSPIHDLYIKSKEENKDVYVTHLGGTDTLGGIQTDPAMKIVTGQNWETTAPDSFASGKGIFYGSWASKTLKGIILTPNNSNPLNLNATGFSKDGPLSIAATAGIKYVAGFNQNHVFWGEDTTQEIATFTPTGIKIGADSDGSDRQLIFGHSTLKSVIGIDDSGDVFAIHTNPTFDAGGINDLEIDTLGNVTIGNGDLIVGNMTIESTGNEITTTGNLVFDTSGDIILDADGGNVFFRDNGDTNFNFALAGVPTLYITGDFTIDGNASVTIDGASGISFKDAGTQRMLIEDATGDVAIGSHLPDYRLDVKDSTDGFVANFENTNTGTSADVLRLKISGTGNLSTGNSFIDFLDGDNDVNGRIRGNGSGGIAYSTAFTGQHPTSIVMNNNITSGMIVESTGEIWSKYSENMETGIPKVTIANSQNSKKVFGVIANLSGSFEGMVKASNQSENETHIEVNSIGEGLVWISNINGNVENGDYITSSDIYGIGQKQSDDILRSYTVAKCTENINWDIITDIVYYNDIAYKKYLTMCTYHCG